MIKCKTLLIFAIQEGNLKRYPTPYPDELKNMVKTVQTIVHRLKDEESSEDTAKESKREGQTVSVKDVGVKVRDNILLCLCKELQRSRVSLIPFNSLSLLTNT